MNTLQNATAILALSAGLALPAHAYTELTLDFTEPTGTVQSSDTIEIWATLSVVGDEPFSFDTNSTDEPIFGLPATLLPEYGNNYSEGLFDVAFDSYSEASLFIGRSCTGSFTSGCSDGQYSIAAATGANSWFEVGSTYTLAPGDQQSFLLYTLTPTTGSATPGTYELYNVALGLTIRGFDADGNALDADVSATTCSSGLAGCAFSRTVVAAVPEPEAWAMLLAGLGLVGWRARRSS